MSTFLETSWFTVSMICAGAYGLFFTNRYKRLGVPVLLRVKGQDFSWTHGMFSPEFIVIAGPYAGRTAVSSFGTSFGFHSKGAEIHGFYIPRNGNIESRATLTIQFYGSIVIPVVGLTILGFQNRSLIGI